MLNTGVSNSPGYSHNNRRSVVCKATSCTLPFCKGVRQACQLNVCLVFGIQVNLIPKGNRESFELH